MLNEMIGPMPQGLLEQQQYPWYIENLVRPLARIGKNLAVGTAGIGDLAELPVNVGRGLLGYEPYPSVSGRVNDYIDKATGGMTVPRDNVESALDFITPFFAPTGIGGAAGKAVNTGGKMYNADLKMPTLVEQARKDPAMYLNDRVYREMAGISEEEAKLIKFMKGLLGPTSYFANKAMDNNVYKDPSSNIINKFKNKYPSMYLTNDEYDKVYNLAKDPANKDKVLHELNVARLKTEKNYPEWQARLHETLGEYGDSLREYGHGLLAKAPEFGQDILKSVTYPGRKAMKEEQVTYDRGLRDRLKNALPLDIQVSQKVPGTPYNFQVPITGKIDNNTLDNVQKVLNKAGSEDSVELLINSPGGQAREGDKIYNALVNSPANTKTTIVGDASSAAARIALGGKTRDAAYNSRFMDHLASNLKESRLSGHASKANNVITEDNYYKVIGDFLSNGELERYMDDSIYSKMSPTEKLSAKKLQKHYRNFQKNVAYQKEISPFGATQILNGNRMQDLLKKNDIFINGQVFKNMPVSNRLPIPDYLAGQTLLENIKAFRSLPKKK